MAALRLSLNPAVPIFFSSTQIEIYITPITWYGKAVAQMTDTEILEDLGAAKK
jgi:hypothetical protein